MARHTPVGAGRESHGGILILTPGAAPPPPLRPPLPLAFRSLNGVIRAALATGRIRLRIEGAEHVPDAGGIIVASNHLSIADPPLVCISVERLVGRRVRYMAKAESFDWPLIGPVMAAYGGFGVRRGRPDREAYRAARQVLESGDWLGLAPEGTRSRTGHLGEAKPGVALLALRTGAPILPVGIAGSEQLWPVGARLPRPGSSVTLRFGPLLRPDELGLGADPPLEDPRAASDPTPPAAARRRESVDQATERLMRRIAALLPAAYRGRFG
jgi:1-acyl-sn-glycerol-3-phosphate acyltransferase